MQSFRSAGGWIAVVVLPGVVMVGSLFAQATDTGMIPRPGASSPSGPSAPAGAGMHRPVLLELFTSEGCPSCPPADDLVAKLQGTMTETGQQIIVLSEHVTYWDEQGWKDPFGQEMFSDRQNSYGEKFELEEVYTPQIIVNGNREVSGNDAAAIRQALQIESYSKPKAEVGKAPADAETVHVVSVQSWLRPKSTQAYAIVTVTMKQALPAGTDLYAVVADDVDVSQVLRGENAGRRMTHVAVARSLMKLPRPNDTGTTTLMVPLPGSAAQPQHLVLFVQEAEQGSVLSVLSVPVPNGFPQSTATR